MTLRNRATDARRIRRFNERAILAELRRGGPASKPEIARRVALTPQAVNGIVDVLIAAGLVREGGRRGGSVGAPSMLYAIRPDGAYSIGLKIGRRSLEALLVDFAGAVLYRAVVQYAEPDVPSVVAAVASGLDSVRGHARAAAIDDARIVGIGVALPGFVTDVGHAFGTADGATRHWRDTDPLALIAEAADLPVYAERDGVASAVAEFMAAAEGGPRSFLFVFVGAFVDGGLVIDGEVRHGPHGRAAQIAAIPVEAPAGAAERWAPLHSRASLMALFAALERAGAPIRSAAEIAAAAETRRAVVDAWLDDAAAALLTAGVAIQATADLDAIVVDADLPPPLVDALIDRLRAGAATRFGPPLVAPRIERTRLGRHAAAIGAAMLPLHEAYSPQLSHLSGRRRPGPADAADAAATA